MKPKKHELKNPEKSHGKLVKQRSACLRFRWVHKEFYSYLQRFAYLWHKAVSMEDPQKLSYMAILDSYFKKKICLMLRRSFHIQGSN